MVVLLVAVGIVLGLIAAWRMHHAFLWLRTNLLLPTAIIGWMFAVWVVLSVVVLAIEYFDGVSSSFELLGFIALLLTALLVLCGVLTLRQRRLFAMPWLQAFGILMAETGTAISAGAALYQFLWPGGDAVAMPIVVSFDGALFVGLVVLEAAPPFLQRLK